MKKLFLLCSGLIITSMLLTACGSVPSQDSSATALAVIKTTQDAPGGANQVVASVNGEKISNAEFLVRAKVMRVQAINRYTQYMQYAQMFGVQDPLNDQNFGPLLQADFNLLNNPTALGQQVIDQEINERLMLSEAKKRGISVSKEEVNRAVQGGFGYYPDGTPTPAPVMLTPTPNATELAIINPGPTATATNKPFGTPSPVTPTATDIATAATPTATAVTESAYNTLLKQRLDGLLPATGLDEAGYRSLIETSLIREKLMADLTKDMKTSEQQVWARHILVATLEEANAVLARLKKGVPFAEVAANVSTDSGSRMNGGDLGWFGKGTMVPPFEEAVFAMQVGQISDPIKTDFGYHIIQLVGKEERTMTNQAIQQAKDKLMTDFMKKLRDAADVQIFEGWKAIVPTEPKLPSQ